MLLEILLNPNVLKDSSSMPKRKDARIDMPTILPGLGREPLKEKGWAEKGLILRELEGRWPRGTVRSPVRGKTAPQCSVLHERFEVNSA